MRNLLLLFLVLISCNKKDNDILSEKKMEAIIKDIAEAEVFVNSYVMKDSTQNKKTVLMKYCDSIFAIHKTTKLAFDKSLENYMSRPEELRALLDSAQVAARQISNSDSKKPKYAQ